jgi:hemoglobin
MKEILLSKPELKAIHARLGDEKIHEILRDFYRRMSGDILIGFFFDGRDLDAIAEKQAEFLLRAMGARPTYSGKSPARAHDELAPILAGHFDRRLRILEETLAAHGLSASDIRTWVSFEETFREAVTGA